MNASLEFGDRIVVNGPSLTGPTEGVFISMTNNRLTWVALGTTGPFSGLPTVFITDTDAHSIEKVA